MPWRREWQPTPRSLPGEFHRQRSMAGYRPWAAKRRHAWATNTFTRVHNVSDSWWGFAGHWQKSFRYRLRTKSSNVLVSQLFSERKKNPWLVGSICRFPWCKFPHQGQVQGTNITSLNIASATWLQHRTEEGPSDCYSLTPWLLLLPADRIRLEKFPCIPTLNMTKAEVRSE